MNKDLLKNLYQLDAELPPNVPEPKRLGNVDDVVSRKGESLVDPMFVKDDNVIPKTIKKPPDKPEIGVIPCGGDPPHEPVPAFDGLLSGGISKKPPDKFASEINQREQNALTFIESSSEVPKTTKKPHDKLDVGVVPCGVGPPRRPVPILDGLLDGGTIKKPPDKLTSEINSKQI